MTMVKHYKRHALHKIARGRLPPVLSDLNLGLRNTTWRPGLWLDADYAHQFFYCASAAVELLLLVRGKLDLDNLLDSLCP